MLYITAQNGYFISVFATPQHFEKPSGYHDSIIMA